VCPLPLYPELQPFDAQRTPRAIGLPRLDAAIWERFRTTNLGLLRTVYFNVHVGTIPGDTAGEDPATRQLRAALWAKRIDVVCITPSETWVLEIKQHLRSAALGQLLVYLEPLRIRLPFAPRFRPLLVGDSIDADAALLCPTLGLECITPPFGPLVPRPAT
jgi:hypothetical protein